MRFPTFPFSEPCVHTGLPAAFLGKEARGAEAQAWSAQFKEVFSGGDKGPAGEGLKRMREIVGGSEGSDGSADWVPENLDSSDPDKDPVQNKGWIAIVHADGNGIGNLILQLGNHYVGDALIKKMREFSAKLNEVTTDSVRVACTRAAEIFKEAHPKEQPHGWILPVIVGGDDVTVILDARMALDFTAELLRQFQEKANEQSCVLEEVNNKVNGKVSGSTPPPITASAGIAFVKPHHPFSDGYDLAEQLCSSAKDLTKTSGANAAAIDYHVLFDSVGRDLDALRDDHVVTSREGDGGLRLWSGPVLVEGETGSEDDCQSRSPAQTAPTLSDLLKALSTVRRGQSPLSNSSWHALRSALVRGGPVISSALKQAELRAEAPPEEEEIAELACIVQDGRHRYGDAEYLSWVIDALALDEVSRGTAR